MTKKKPEPRDALDLFDALTSHLNAATGIVHACSIASLNPNSVDDRRLHYALEAAFDELEDAKEAATGLWEARKPSEGGTS